MWKRIPRDYPANVKKNELKPWQNKEWCIPAKRCWICLCYGGMLLEVYKRSYDETHPLICMDEAASNTLRRHFSQYRQNQTPLKSMIQSMYVMVSVICSFFWTVRGKTACGGNGSSNSQPGWCGAPLRWTHYMVMDNLNTPTGASFYKAFAPEEARRIPG